VARSEDARTLSQCRGFNLGFSPSLSSASFLSEELAPLLTSSVVFVIPVFKMALGLEAEGFCFAITVAGIEETTNVLAVSKDPIFLDVDSGAGAGAGGGGGGGGGGILLD